MNTLIFRTLAPTIVAVTLLFSVSVLLRGHNAPGGGFIGGLIGAAAVALYAMARGSEATRQALRVDPLAIAGFGVLLAALSGLPSLLAGTSYLTGFWGFFDLGETSGAVSTPMLFDIGVYFTVLGAVSAVALALEDEGEGE